VAKVLSALEWASIITRIAGNILRFPIHDYGEPESVVP